MGTLDFKKIFDYIPESLIVLNPAEEIVYCNLQARKYENLASRPLDEGVSFIDVVSPERREIVREILKRVKSSGMMQTTEPEYPDAEGRPHFFEAVYNPMLDASNKLELICIAFHEITIQKTFEKRATQLLQDYSSLIETANAVIFSLDSRGYVTEWNNECIRITGYEKNDVFTKKIYPFIEESHRFELFLSGILREALPGNFELHLNTQKEKSVVVLVTATPKLNASGNVVGVLFVGQDITELSEYKRSLEQKVLDRTEELKKALAKEKELIELKNRFVSIASHEFRIPLSTIESSANFVMSNTNLRPHDIEKLDVILKHIGHMRSLVEDVLTLGKTEAAKIKASHSEFDLVCFVKNIIEEVLNSGPQTHRVNFKPSGSTVKVECDEKLLRNIFINLLSNAIKFSPGKEEVDLILIQQGNNVMIKFVNRGIGIPDDDLSSVFEPFNRASNASEIKGTGLGLSIVKKAVDALDGQLAVESKSGNGTTITVTLKARNMQINSMN